MEAPPLLKPKATEEPEDKIAKVSEYELNHENKKYNLTLSLTDSNYLIFNLKEEGITPIFFLNRSNLNDLSNIDKKLGIYDTELELYEALNDLLKQKQATIQKNDQNFSINFLYPLPGNKTKEIKIPFKRKIFEQKNLNDEIVKKVNDLEEKLNKEIEENKKNKNIINELKEEINNLKNEINILKEWKKEKDIKKKLKEEKEKGKESNIIKDPKEYEFIENRLKLTGNKGEIRYKLLYRATTDGDKAKTFHEKCDTIKGTLTLVKTTDNIKFGGYTEALWSGSGYKTDEKAFCFSLNLNKIYNVAKKEEAITSDNNYGPRFAGTLFGIKDNTFKNGGWCSYTSSSDIQYGKLDKEREITGGKQYFGVSEVEVFQIIFK